VDQIENLYWNLVFAYENVRVAQESLAFAQKTLSDNQKQVQIGSLAPIEVVRAQNTVAADQQSLIQAQTNLDLQQLLVKNALSRSLQDPALASAEVIPTTTMALPQQEPVVPTEDLINQALQHRAELAEQRIDLTNRDISNKAIKNSLLPSLDLFAYYGGSGLGGSQNPGNLCANQNPQGFGCASSSVPSIGYSDTLDQLVNSTAADKGMGVTLSIPIKNRQAQALSTRAQLEYRQAQMRTQQLENQIRIERPLSWQNSPSMPSKRNSIWARQLLHWSFRTSPDWRRQSRIWFRPWQLMKKLKSNWIAPLVCGSNMRA